MTEPTDWTGNTDDAQVPPGAPGPSDAHEPAAAQAGGDAPAGGYVAGGGSPPTEPLPDVAAGGAGTPAAVTAAPTTPSSAPQQRPASKPTWKAAALVLAVLASGLIGGFVGNELGDGGRSGTFGPVPATGGSVVKLPAEGLAELYNRVLPTIVQIEAPGEGADSSGSGVIVDPSGTVVTAAHVVANRDEVTVILSDGRRLQAKVLGRDEQGDLAVLEIADAPDDLAAASLGDSDDLAVGQTIAALGAPFGLRNSLTVGVISGVNRTFSPSPTGPPLRGLIQTDAAINPGSSGGPLFDLAGQVIGINTAIKSPVGGSVGVGFAVPVNQVRDSLPLLSEGKEVQRPFLGIEGKAGTRGVDVVNVTAASSAAGAGIQSGDVILSVDGAKVRTVDDIAAQLTKHEVGDRVEVTIDRGGNERKLTVELKPLPASRP